MPRRQRQIFANTPAHVVQRGNNRRPCFLSFRDYRSYLAALSETSIEYDVDVHAFVLMTNHVHLLVTPRQDVGVSRMMQQLGRKYVSYFNKTHDRSGTLWEGRFRSSVVATSKYLYACHRYIEMNPVRAGLVDAPEKYEWSSYRSNALGHASTVVRPNSALLRLGNTDPERLAAYQRLFVGAHDRSDTAIRQACKKGQILGQPKKPRQKGLQKGL